MATAWYDIYTDRLKRKGLFSNVFIRKSDFWDDYWIDFFNDFFNHNDLMTFLMADESSLQANKMPPVCLKFNSIHHCNWRNYSKSCTTRVQDYLEILNHS